MKFGLLAQTARDCIIEHTKNVSVGIDSATEAVIVENAGTYVPNIKALNTSLAVRNMIAQPELERLFRQDVGIVEGVPQSYLYGFMSGKGLSEMLEISYSRRFLTGNAGPVLGFVQGTGMLAVDAHAAFPTLAGVEQALVELEYLGEIALGCTKEFQICDIQFGHNTGFFSLFTELSHLAPNSNYEWCLGIGDACKLHEEGIASTTLLSLPPFPHITQTTVPLVAPPAAERHLYRTQVAGHSLAYATAWGLDVREVKRRLRRTIENCVAYNNELQYRVDYGHREVFTLMQERYRSLDL